MAHKLVVNCEAQSIVHLFDEADAWEAKGRPDQAEKVRHAARAAMIAADISDPQGEAVRRVPLTAAEEKQRDENSKAAAKQTAADEKLAADRAALVARLKSGKASPDEVQSALAQLLA